MQTNAGTLILAAVRPNNTQDTYPVALSNEVKGGHHTYPTYLALLNIPTSRKQAGMLVTVTDDPDSTYNNTYVLKPDLVTWEYLESNFLMVGQLDSITASYTVALLLSAPYTYKINKLFVKTTFGSCDLNILINNISMTGFQNINVDTSLIEISSTDPSNYIPNDSALDLQITAPSANLGVLLFQLELTRILPIVPTPTLSVCGLQGAFSNYFII